MSFNLIDSVKDFFSDDLVSRAASALGENTGNMQQAITGAVPSVLAGILNRAGSGDVNGVLNMAKDASGSGIIANLGGVFSGGAVLSKGADMLRGIFGERTSNVTSLISGFSGIKESSASSLLSIAAPAALGLLGEHVAENDMNAGDLLSFLNAEKDSILNSLPSGLNLAGALGLGSLNSIGTKLSNTLAGVMGSIRGAGAKFSNSRGAIENTSGGARWVLPLILAIIAIGLVWYFMRGCNDANKAAEAMTDTVTKATGDTTAATTSNVPARESMKVKLPDDTEIDAYKGGIEDQLVVFLNNPLSKPGKNVWFDFDDLNFKTGSADITDSSQRQIKNIVAILKAYPKLKIKIGGYTDKTGDSLSNLKLSKSRAGSVVAALKSSGAKAAQVTGAEGYGSQFAKAAADAPDEERKKDRRISVSVRDK